MTSCQKLGIILVVNGFKKWFYQKMSITKKCAPQFVFFNEKKIDFESQIFALFDTNSHNSMISFDYSWFLAKNLSNFGSLLWNLHNRHCHTVNISKISKIVFLFSNMRLQIWVSEVLKGNQVFKKQAKIFWCG